MADIIEGEYDVEDDADAPEPMDEEQFATAVKQSLDDAVDYIDGYVATSRAQATGMYRGDLFGNEEPGRSQFVMTEVRDTVLAMMPSLLRIFTSSEQAVSFEPRTAAKVEMAEQATDYVNYIFFCDNDGFTTLYNAFKDALIRKSGVLKWRWDEDISVTEYAFTGLSDGQLQLLLSDPEVEVVEQSSQPLPGWQPPPPQAMMPPPPLPGAPPPPVSAGPEAAAASGATPPPVAPDVPQPGPGVPPGAPPMQAVMAPPPPPVAPTVHDIKIRRVHKKGRVKVECVPVEELLVSRTGRDLDTCPLVGHRSLKTHSDLVKMGIDPEKLEGLGGLGDTFMTNYEATVRNPAVNSFNQTPDINDPSATKVVYNEAYIHIDKDGDGIAELRRVCMVGETVLYDEVVDEVPFAILCPDPEPHMLIGNSVADMTMDIQILMSAIVRNVMDSLAQSIHPRTAVVENQVNMDDVMNVETGAIVRMRAPGMVQEMNTTFVGAQAMPVISWLNEVKAKRTGVVPAAAGLDPDILQSTTKSGVDATVQGAQERTEMTARLFAEGGIKRMMRGILRLVCRHQEQARMVRLRGKWVEADPKSWDADMDVITHVALGRGTDADRLQALALIATKQEACIQLAGADNPVADLSNLRTTYAKMTEIMGYKAAEEFFKVVDMNKVKAEQAQKPPPPDPNMLVAQAQQQKVQAQIQMDQMQQQLDQQRLQLDGQKAKAEAEGKTRQQEIDAELERQRMAMEDAREREKIRVDAVIRLQIAELQYGTQVKSAEVQRELDEADLLQDVVKHRATLDREDMHRERDRQFDLRKHELTTAQKAEAARLAAEAKGRPDA